MQKESKYTRRERLKRMGIIEVNGIQKEIKNVNKELISSIDNYEFWEDMENLIKEENNIKALTTLLDEKLLLGAKPETQKDPNAIQRICE